MIIKMCISYYHWILSLLYPQTLRTKNNAYSDEIFSRYDEDIMNEIEKQENIENIDYYNNNNNDEESNLINNHISTKNKYKKLKKKHKQKLNIILPNCIHCNKIILNSDILYMYNDDPFCSNNCRNNLIKRFDNINNNNHSASCTF